MRSIGRRMWSTIGATVKNTPVEVAIIMSTAALLSMSIEFDVLEEETLVATVMTAFLMLCATFAVSASHALKVFDSRTRWALTGAFVFAASAYGGGILDVEATTELWRYGFLATAAVMGITLVPVAARLGEATTSERFWRYNLRIGSRVLIAVVYSSLLYVGLALALAAVDELFGIAVPSDIYSHLFCWVGIALGGVLAVAGLSDVKRIDERFDEPSLVWLGRLGTWLFVPLLLLYLGIMYLYLGKVMFTGDVPSNILSPLALGAGLLGYLGTLVLHPFLNRTDFRPLSFVLRRFPAAFVPLVPLGMWAIWQRIEQYGWTEFRYARMAALVCLGVFTVVGTIKWLRGRELSLAIAPAIVGVVALMAAVGPWSASHVSEQSQRSRFVSAASAKGLMTADGRLVDAAEVRERTLDSETEMTLRESMRYLLSAHGDEAVEDLVSIDLSSYHHDVEKLGALGLDHRLPPPADPSKFRAISLRADEPMRLADGQAFTQFNVSANHEAIHRGFVLQLEGSSLNVRYEEGTGRVDLSKFVTAMEAGRAALDGESSRAHIVTDDGQIVGTVILRDVQYERREEGWHIRYLSGFVFM